MCGAANTGFGLRCTICGYVYEAADTVAQYWDSVVEPNRTSHSATLDREEDDIDESDEQPVLTDDDRVEITATTPYRPVVDPWSSIGGRLGAEPGSPQAFTTPTDAANATRRDGGPPGWLLGLAGSLLIGLVAVAALVLVAQPLLADRVESATSDAIGMALSDVTVVPDAAAGTVVVDEAEINRTIRANREDYAPLEDLRIQIRRRGIVATFSVYGLSGTLTGSVEVVDDRIVIADPSVNGIADRMINVDSIAESGAEAINDLLARNHLKPTAVTLADDTLTITTTPRK
jgi:hypothetical protein